jgi:nucleotidyltransferase
MLITALPGAVKLAEKFIKGDFIVISGDVLTDFNLREVFDFHKVKIQLQRYHFTALKIRSSSV